MCAISTYVTAERRQMEMVPPQLYQLNKLVGYSTLPARFKCPRPLHRISFTRQSNICGSAIIKPRMRSLRMILYHGGGAGGARFVPPNTSDYQHCELLHYIKTYSWNIITDGDSTWRNPSVCSSLAELGMSLSHLSIAQNATTLRIIPHTTIINPI